MQAHFRPLRGGQFSLQEQPVYGISSVSTCLRKSLRIRFFSVNE
jgi:hypothetical protein